MYFKHTYRSQQHNIIHAPQTTIEATNTKYSVTQQWMINPVRNSWNRIISAPLDSRRENDTDSHARHSCFHQPICAPIRNWQRWLSRCTRNSQPGGISTECAREKGRDGAWKRAQAEGRGTMEVLLRSRRNRAWPRGMHYRSAGIGPGKKFNRDVKSNGRLLFARPRKSSEAVWQQPRLPSPPPFPRSITHAAVRMPDYVPRDRSATRLHLQSTNLCNFQIVGWSNDPSRTFLFNPRKATLLFHLATIYHLRTRVFDYSNGHLKLQRSFS